MEKNSELQSAYNKYKWRERMRECTDHSWCSCCFFISSATILDVCDVITTPFTTNLRVFVNVLRVALPWC